MAFHKVLYPELRHHEDASVAALAQRFEQEMSGIAGAVEAYGKRWPTASAITADPAGFIAETTQVLETLAKRIAREDSELYAAADATRGATLLG
jgi:hypothetical protein